MSHFVAVVLAGREADPEDEALVHEAHEEFVGGRLTVGQLAARVGRALTPKTPSVDGAQALAGPLLEPFDENAEAEPYETACDCVGAAASGSAHERFADVCPDYRDRVEALRGEIRDVTAAAVRETHGEAEAPFTKIGECVDVIIEAYRETPELARLREQEKALAGRWFALHDERDATIQRLEGEHPMHGKPDPDCPECDGTGTVMSTYNPRSQWDWWVVGGRWTGFFDADYEPGEDPRNYGPCHFCDTSGQGVAVILAEAEGRDLPELTPSGKVNGDGPPFHAVPEDEPGAKVCHVCDGTKIERRWHNAPYDGDVVAGEEYLARLDAGRDLIPYAVVTPDGEWHQRGQMGWWGMSSDEKERDEWAKQVRALVTEHSETWAIAVDCHI